MNQSGFIIRTIQQAKSEKRKISKLIRNLKSLSPKTMDAAFMMAHEQIFNQQINCLDCANCCRSLGPRLTDKDIDRLAKHLKLKPSQFTERYLRLDEDGDYVFRNMPCPFLADDNYCKVYEQRPKACSEYPHTDRKKMHQLLDVTKKNASVCPAVYLIIKHIG